MTYNQIINYVDLVYPNSFDQNTKLMWLCEADGLVRAEVHGEPPASLPEKVTILDSPSVPVPHVRLYSYYLFAMIDFLLSDYDRYKISSEMFEKAMEIYAKWYIRHAEA